MHKYSEARKTIILLLAVCVPGFAAQAYAQDWAHAMFETAKHDFGEVLAGEVVEQRFKIKNDTTEKYRLRTVVSASEFSAKLSAKSIAAGESAELICRFVPQRNGLGARRGTVTVRLIGEEKGEHQIALRGKSSLAVFLPSELSFGNATFGEEVKATAKLTIAKGANLALSDVQCKYRHVRAKVGKPTEVEGALVYHMTFRLLASAPVGKVENKLSFVFRKKDKPKAEEVIKRLPFKARVKREK